jgi:hypothetical protein
MSEMEKMELLPSMASGFEFHRYWNGSELQVLQIRCVLSQSQSNKPNLKGQ